MNEIHPDGGKLRWSGTIVFFLEKNVLPDVQIYWEMLPNVWSNGTRFSWNSSKNAVFEKKTKKCPQVNLFKKEGKKRNRKFKCGLFLLKPTWSVESQDTSMLL